MARRRYLSTDISTDDKVNRLSTFAALLYTWATPHFADNCRLTPQNAAEVKMAVIPGRKESLEEVEKAMQEIFSVGLWGRDENARIFVPSVSFYKYQTYINAANRRETPQIAASPSPSPSPSPKEDKKPPAALFVLPDWIPEKSWRDYEEHRRKMRTPLSTRAKELAVKQLELLREEGHEPADVLDNVIARGWRGIFAPKENGSKPPAPKPRAKVERPPELTEEQIAKNKAFLKDLLGKIGAKG